MFASPTPCLIRQRWWLACGLAVWSCICASLSSPADAQVYSNEEAVDIGAEALSDRGYYPWYDEENDSVRPINVPVSEEPYEAPLDQGNRVSGWSQKVGKSSNTPANAPTFRRAGAASAFSGLGMLVGWILIVVLAVVIAVVVGLLAWAFLSGDSQIADSQERSAVVDSSYDVDRVEDLPFTINRPSGDLLGSAQAAYEAGNYSEAAIYLFSYQLLQLDRNQLIHLTRGKTNRQYVRELRQRPRLAIMLESAMHLFEDAFFGRQSVPRDDFEDCWRGMADFHRLVREGVTA